MGTRADFYVGRGKTAEWLGSIAWDGHPESIDQPILASAEESTFRDLVRAFINSRDDGTKPEDGWPWPWNDSGTTDYSYAFDDGKVWARSFGHGWFMATEGEPDEDVPKVEFPDMTKRANVQLVGPKSGSLIVTVR